MKGKFEEATEEEEKKKKARQSCRVLRLFGSDGYLNNILNFLLGFIALFGITSNSLPLASKTTNGDKSKQESSLLGHSQKAS
jgi:hypothetical protein